MILYIRNWVEDLLTLVSYRQWSSAVQLGQLIGNTVLRSSQELKSQKYNVTQRVPRHNPWAGHIPLKLSGDLLMRFLQMLVGCLALLMAAIFAGQNTSTVSLRLFRLNSVDLPLGLVLIGAVVIGIWSSMVFAGIFTKRRRPVQSAFQSFTSSSR